MRSGCEKERETETERDKDEGEKRGRSFKFCLNGTLDIKESAGNNRKNNLCVKKNLSRYY